MSNERDMKKLRHTRALATRVQLIQDISEFSSPVDGYLRRYRHRVKTELSDQTRTDVYVVDFIDRDARIRDAIAVAVFARPKKNTPPGATLVLLRRQVRYGAYLAVGTALVTEVICGLIEAPESPEETTARELYEEAGMNVSAGAVKPLGKPTFVLPSVLTERMFPMAAEVSEEMMRFAVEEHESGDGSPFEQGAEHIVLTLDEALAANVARAPDGTEIEIADTKTELILRRLHEALREGRL